MRLFVIGASGLVGSNIVAASLDRDWPAFGTYRSNVPSFETPLYPLNVLNYERFERLIQRTNPDAVINCVAMTDVDACEENPERADSVNAVAPGKLAKICEESGISFVHLSTDYVFDGKADVPYEEAADANPIQKYGSSKLAGERKVRSHHNAPLIVRLSFVYGMHRAPSSKKLAGFPAWISDRLQAGESVPLFTDQYVSPSQAGQASESILDLLDARFTGTFHVASRSCITPYEFGVAFCARVGAPKELLERTSIKNVERPASRPQYTCLDVRKVESYLERKQPRLEPDLDDVIEN